MATNALPKSDVLFMESPVSWNTRYVTPEGFECQFTLRGETGQEVLEKAGAAIGYLLKNGCTPAVFNKGYPRKGNSSSNVGEKASSSESNGDNGNNPNWCSIHNCEMKKWEKDGRVWYSHKVDGKWCTGKEK